MLAGLEFAPDEVPGQFESGRYEEMRAALTNRFAGKPRDEWTTSFAGADACVTPVLSWTEATGDEHLLARGTLVGIDGMPPQRTASMADIDG